MVRVVGMRGIAMANATLTEDAFLLDLLNSTPVIDGTAQDLLEGSGAGAWQRERGGTGSEAERKQTVAARNILQDVVRGRAAVTSLAPLLKEVRSVPTIDGDGVVWTTQAKPARSLAVRAVLAWDEVRRANPGRLRPCANPDCALFLLDHSKANQAHWCSMAVCGNRMKARRHYERTRSAR